MILVNSQQAEELDPNEQPGTSRWWPSTGRRGNCAGSAAHCRVCYPTPCIYQPQNAPPELICYDTADGLLQSRSAHRHTELVVLGLHDATVASPIVVDDLVFGSNGSGGGGNYLVAVRMGKQPQEVYRLTRQAPYVSTPVAQDGLVYLYFDRGFVSCMQAADGEIVWSKRLTSGFSGSPVLVDGN